MNKTKSKKQQWINAFKTFGLLIIPIFIIGLTGLYTGNDFIRMFNLFFSVLWGGCGARLVAKKLGWDD